MTKKVNTELARVRAAAKALRKATAPEGSASVQPAIVSTLSDARAIVARELQIMRDLQDRSEGMSLQDAKKLQSLMATLSAAESIQKGQSPDLEELSDAELDAELLRLQAEAGKDGQGK